MNKKYEFTGETKEWRGVTLRRIRAVVAIASLGVNAGDLGGWIEKEDNLSQLSGDAWVYGNARVSGDARVSGNARVYGNAQLSGNAQVYGDACVSGDACVFGNAWVYGNARVSGNARVYGDACVSTVNIVATRTDGYDFLVAPTPDGPRIIAGCRYFTFKDAKDHWKKTRGGTKLGDESLAIVKYLETMAKLNGFMEPVK